jgi:hypothetical protein
VIPVSLKYPARVFPASSRTRFVWTEGIVSSSEKCQPSPDIFFLSHSSHTAAQELIVLAHTLSPRYLQLFPQSDSTVMRCA